FATVQQGYIFEESAVVMTHIIELISQVRKLKTEKQLSLKVPLASLTICATDEHLLHKIEAHTQLIRGITHAQEIHFKPVQKTQPNQLQQVDSTWQATVSLEKS